MQSFVESHSARWTHVKIVLAGNRWTIPPMIFAPVKSPLCARVRKFRLILGRSYRYHIPRTMDLNDARIREALLRRLDRQKARPRAVLEELHVHNGSAIWMGFNRDQSSKCGLDSVTLTKKTRNPKIQPLRSNRNSEEPPLMHSLVDRFEHVLAAMRTM